MTTNEIMAMAREAGMNLTPAQFSGVLGDEVDEFKLERFAALVAAAEREACAQVCANEEARALYNFDNDLEANRPFWNGGSQIATSCEVSIRARGSL